MWNDIWLFCILNPILCKLSLWANQITSKKYVCIALWDTVFCALGYSCSLHILLNVAGHLGITWRNSAYYAQFWNISTSSMLLQTDLTTTHQSDNCIRCNSHCRFSTDKTRQSHKKASKHTLAHDSRKETHTNKQAHTHRMRMCGYFPLYTHWSTVKSLLCEEMMSFVRIGQQGLLKPVTPLENCSVFPGNDADRGSWHFTS